MLYTGSCYTRIIPLFNNLNNYFQLNVQLSQTELVSIVNILGKDQTPPWIYIYIYIYMGCMSAAGIQLERVYLQHCLDWAAGRIGQHDNAEKTDFMSYNQRGDIFTPNRRSLTVVDKSTYQGSSIASTENGIKTQLAKVWTAVNRLSVIWKSDLSDKMNCCFSKQWSVNTAVWIH